MTTAIVDLQQNGADMRDFLELPAYLYRNDPDYIPDSEEKTLASLLRAKFVGRQRAFLQRKAKPVARVVARISPVLEDDGGSPIGMLGFFEACEFAEDVAQLLNTATGWLREQGVKTVVGPMDGDSWHRYRFNVGPFDQPPFLLEPYNKPYYHDLWLRAGFQPLERYYSKSVSDVAAAAKPLARFRKRVQDHGYRLRPFVMARFEEELEVIYRLSIEIFADNFLYEEISLEDFLALYRPAQSLVDPQLVLIAEAATGEPVGFVFSLIDYHRAIAAMSGRSGLFAKLRFLRHRRDAQAVNIKSLGVVSAHRRTGLAAALMYESYQATLRKGFRRANLCLIREGNPSGDLDGGEGIVSRHYLLLQHQPNDHDVR